jgi:hypothetical protein
MKHLRIKLSVLTVVLALTSIMLAGNAAPASADVTIRSGGGYNVTVGTSSIRVVFSRSITGVLFDHGVAQDCKACLVWTAVAWAKAIPQSQTACNPWWPHWPCWTATNLRSHFIYDVEHRTNELFLNIINAHYIHGNCLYWKITGSRSFSTTSDGCKN